MKLRIGFLGVMGLMFIGLKLGKVIDWSWWWVLVPLWGPTAIAVLIFLIMFMVWSVNDCRQYGWGKRKWGKRKR